MSRFIVRLVIALNLLAVSNCALSDITDKSYWVKKIQSVAQHSLKAWNDRDDKGESDSSSAADADEVAPKVLAFTGEQLVIDYHRFTVYYDCNRRGFDYSTFVAHEDVGDLPRYEPFNKEPLLENYDCPSQKTTSSYKKTPGHPQYHRGHGITSNHNDDSEYYMSLTNRMTNVVPHNGVQNTRGLWRHLEKRVECARDVAPVTVYLGNYWGNDTSNDLFIRTHGVPTPDYIWRIHVYDKYPNQAFVWLIKNDESTLPADEDSARVDLEKLKTLLSSEYDISLPDEWVTSNNKDPYRNLTCSLK
ncbi:DNA/RNA non-specific endonuclease [Alteromonas sp. 14N.309.X.WAT.G.H12]|uniref:DNA/RNA non-specific endonuclease n=1 Tax=Alteromonas sp. 14N.309.X.WAT.G.H12 TaxID=3120824 RepID=UPI002FD2B12B